MIINESNSNDTTLTINFNDYDPVKDTHFIKMLQYIKKNAGTGHSFKVVVDPETSDSTETFYLDGDGGFKINTIEVDGKSVNENFSSRSITEDTNKEVAVTVTFTDYNPEKSNLIKLLSYIKNLANPGHTFDVVVDPNYDDTKQSFEMDGDGMFSISDIKVNGKLVK